MIGMACGLALSGYVPVCYSITPFLLFRPFELIRNYVNNEKINIKLVGTGRDRDYAHDGFTHWGEDDVKFMEKFENIKLYKPTELNDIVWHNFISTPNPSYLNLKRF
jgi:transketolase